MMLFNLENKNIHFIAGPFFGDVCLIEESQKKVATNESIKDGGSASTTLNHSSQN